ncbi:hypothetical protein ACP70R_015183 [Stipagrostis hirtigluma subsp. patula]
MAAMVRSAVIQETVSQILSGLARRYEGKEKLNANENLERLEMAHIKLDAALETSNKWLITDVSLLRWRKKLKRAAQECDETLHKCKQRVLEEKQMVQEARNSSLGKQIAHVTKSFVFSFIGHNDNELSRSIVRRFEWFADGASEFLRFVQYGGTPRCHIHFDSLTKYLFAGKELQHKIVRGNENHPLMLLLLPFSTSERGIEVFLLFIQEDFNAPEVNFVFSLRLQLSESTDIIGIAVKCLQLFTPHFKSTVEVIMKALAQLPTQDFTWLPHGDLCKRKLLDNLHTFNTQWSRPDPLCCGQYDQQKLLHVSNLDMVGLPDVSLERVIDVSLLCHVSVSEYSKQRASLSDSKNSLQGSPYLKAGLFCSPHESSEDMLPADKNSVVSGIYGAEKQCLHTDITFEELKDMMLPKAVDYFHQNIEATVYQMLWKSKHGAAYIQIEKAGMETPSERSTSRRARKRKLVQRQDQELPSRAHIVGQLLNLAAPALNLWVAHAPIRVRGLILNWIQTVKSVSNTTAVTCTS